MKLLGFLLLIVVTTYMGFNKSRKLTYRIDLISEIKKYISFSKTEIRYNLSPPKDVLMKYSKSSNTDFIKRCSEKIENGERFYDIWEENINKMQTHYALNEIDKRLILEFGSGLGGSDVEGQLSHCDLYEEYLNAQYQQAVEEKNKKSKLYILLGNAVGLAICLVIW